MEQIEAIMNDLQAQRSAGRSETDVREIVAQLRMHRAPPPPEIEAVPETAENPADGVDSPGPAATAVPRLQGIAWHPDVPLAILNGRTLGVGESVSGHRIVRIDRDRIVVEAPDGGAVELRLDDARSPSP